MFVKPPSSSSSQPTRTPESPSSRRLGSPTTTFRYSPSMWDLSNNQTAPTQACELCNNQDTSHETLWMGDVRKALLAHRLLSRTGTGPTTCAAPSKQQHMQQRWADLSEQHQLLTEHPPGVLVELSLLEARRRRAAGRRLRCTRGVIIAGPGRCGGKGSICFGADLSKPYGAE